MSRSRISIHAIPVHKPDRVIRAIELLKPPLVLIVDPDPNFISRAYQVAPNALFSLRNHPLSEQKQDMYADAVGTGQRHAREMVEWCDKIYAEATRRALPMPPLAQVILPGINEPLVMTDEQINAVAKYNVAYLNELTTRGRRGSCLEFSVGWPRNSGTDLPPEWEPFRPVYEAAKRGKHVASIHEYWPNEGPSYWASWLCYRCVMWVPDYWADVPFIFTEVGLDDAAAPGRSHRFWKTFFWQNPQAYVDQYVEYERNCRTLTNRNGVAIDILGYCIFTEDYAGKEWEDADIDSIVDLFATMANTVDFPDHPPRKDDTIHLPYVPNEPPDEPDDNSPSPVQNDLLGWTLEAMTRLFDYDLNMLKALLAVESGGRSFVGGKPIIRFEAHIMRANMDHKGTWERYFQVNPVRQWEDQMWRRSEGDPWKVIHTGKQTDEWQVFEFAKTIHARAAHLALGMGAAQIMGFNHNTVNFNSPEAMLAAFSDLIYGAANQVLAMFAYIYKTPGLVDAVRTRNLPEIARLYNGSGQIDYYVKRFTEELAKLEN